MTTRQLTLAALFLALLIVCAQISIPLGTVPITLQTLAVLLIGLCLPPKLSLLVSTSYVLLGLVGLPVFAGGAGGFQSIFSPSFGYLIGFIIATSVMSAYLTHTSPTIKSFTIASIVGTAIIYVFGVSYLAYVLNVQKQLGMDTWAILTAGMIPFLPGDALKTVIAIVIRKKLSRYFA